MQAAFDIGAFIIEEIVRPMPFCLLGMLGRNYSSDDRIGKLIENVFGILGGLELVSFCFKRDNLPFIFRVANTAVALYLISVCINNIALQGMPFIAGPLQAG